MKRLMMLALITMATGCGDPVEGNWISQQPATCGQNTTFNVDGDLTGSGDTCGCHFTFALTTAQPGVYNADVNFQQGCILLLDGNYTCTLRANDQELDCGILGNYDRANI